MNSKPPATTNNATEAECEWKLAHGYTTVYELECDPNGDIQQILPIGDRCPGCRRKIKVKK